MVALDDVTVPAPEPSAADWNDAGVVVLPRLLGDELLEAYEREWWEANGTPELSRPLPDAESLQPLVAERPGGWPDAIPYMRHPALLDVVCHPLLGAALQALLGEPAGVHLNLTGWVSTERDWHQDSYLNEPEVGDHYAAVWIALGTVHPDSGPFEYVPGSHRWPQVTRELIGRYVDLDDPAWPKHSEDVLSPLFEAEIARRGAQVVEHLPQRGDVLIWHGRLLHRGSRATMPGAYRPALIAHYSGVEHRPRMGRAVQHTSGGWYFPLQTTTPV